MSWALSEDDDTWLVLSCGVRYALGRQSYIVGTVCDWVERHWDGIPERAKELIARDVLSALEQYDHSARTLGMEMDIRSWQGLGKFIKGKTTT